MTQESDDMNADEFANDIDKSVGALLDMIEAQSDGSDGQASALPIDPRTFMDNMVRPRIYQYALKKPRATKRALAVVHRASGDILDKHSDKTPDELI